MYTITDLQICDTMIHAGSESKPSFHLPATITEKPVEKLWFIKDLS